MFCSKCGQKNDENSIFCHNCGEKIISIEENNEIKNDNISLQIKEYNVLPWYKSYRKISSSLFIFSSIITIVAVLFDIVGREYLFDLIIVLPLAIFMYKGKKWAIILSIVYWVFSKIYQIYSSYNSGDSSISHVLWLITYVSVFYQALKVELEKDKIKNIK